MKLPARLEPASKPPRGRLGALLAALLAKKTSGCRRHALTAAQLAPPTLHGSGSGSLSADESATGDRHSIRPYLGVVDRIDPARGFGYVHVESIGRSYIFVIGVALSNKAAARLRPGAQVKVWVDGERRVRAMQEATDPAAAPSPCQGRPG